MRETREGDDLRLAADLRASDLREIQATSAAKPLIAIRRCIARSDHCWTGEIDGEIAFIGGATPESFPARKRSPWLLATPLIETHHRQFIRYCIQKMPEIRRCYPFLENYIDARSTKTIHWLRWLGFTIHPPEPYGVLGREFHRFTLMRGG